MTKKTLITLLVITLMTLTYPVTAIASSEPNVSSESAILIEAETGQVLYEKNADVKQYPASITKVLTAIVVIENNELDDVVVVGEDVPYQIESGSSSIYLIPGEKLTVEELLYALMVESANDAAVALAEHTSGSVEKFVELMNEKAKAIGATSSHFVNPNGLHDENHYVTAHDMALIMREAIKNPLLLKLMTTPQYTIPETNKQQTRYLWTKNKLYKTQSDKYYYDKVIASKTGYTSDAGNTLVSAAKDNDMTLITVVLKANGVETYEDTLSMFDYGFENFRLSELVKKDEYIEELEVDGAVNNLKLVSRGTVNYVENISESEDIESKIELLDELPSSIDKGDKVGKLIYSLGENEIGEVDLIAGNDVVSETSAKINKVKQYLIWIIPTLFVLYLLLRIYVHIKNVQIRRRKIRRKYSRPYKNNLFNKKKKSKRNEYYKY